MQDRYCIGEKYVIHYADGKQQKEWIFYYSDGTEESVWGC